MTSEDPRSHPVAFGARAMGKPENVYITFNFGYFGVIFEIFWPQS